MTGAAMLLRLIALSPVTVCRSVVQRSEPASVRFKAAIAPRGNRVPPSIAEQIRVIFAGLRPACPQIGSASPGGPGP